jgi:hypothetical protein
MGKIVRVGDSFAAVDEILDGATGGVVSREDLEIAAVWMSDLF